MILSQLIQLLGLSGPGPGASISDTGRMDDQTFKGGAPGAMSQSGAMPQRAALLAALLGGAPQGGGGGLSDIRPVGGNGGINPGGMFSGGQIPGSGRNFAALLALLGRGGSGGGMMTRPGGETPPIRSDLNYFM